MQVQVLSLVLVLVQVQMHTGKYTIKDYRLYHVDTVNTKAKQYQECENAYHENRS